MHGLGLGGDRDEGKARRQTAAHGNAAAMNNLGHMLWRGEGGVAEPSEARKLIKQAAEAGFAPARTISASCFGRVGGSKDPARTGRVSRGSAALSVGMV